MWLIVLNIWILTWFHKVATTNLKLRNIHRHVVLYFSRIPLLSLVQDPLMSHPHLSCFLNDKRPRLKNPLVKVCLCIQRCQKTRIYIWFWTRKTLPTDVLGPDLSTQVLASQTQVDDSNGSACAALGRLWEDVLEMYRVPYLMLRVADMRMALGSEVTALSLYQEVH